MVKHNTSRAFVQPSQGHCATLVTLAAIGVHLIITALAQSMLQSSYKALAVVPEPVLRESISSFSGD